MNFIGVDPGLHGGLSHLTRGQPCEWMAMPLAGKEIDLAAVAAWVGQCGWNAGPVDLVVIERVHAMPKQGVSSSFTFGMGYGGVLGVCAALKLSVQLVTPQAWKRVVLAGTGKDKAAAVDFCRRRWPGVDLVSPGGRKAHDGIADALCLAEYGRRVFGDGG